MGTPLPEGKMPWYVFVANRWDSRPSTADTVVVFGNVEEVALLVNGKEIKRQRADKGGDTDYVAKADGGNCRQLNYPPFTFTGIKWEAGTIRAVGYSNGKKVTQQEIRTSGEPRKLLVEYFQSGKTASRHDLLIVNVSITDENGTLCAGESTPVSLAVEGGALHGPAQYNAEAGIASFIVKCGDGKAMKIQASAGNLQGNLNLRLQ